MALAWALFPFYWAVIVSLKGPLDRYTLAFIPFLQFQPTIGGWFSELGPQGRGPELLRSFGNSLTLSLGAAAIALLLGTPAGYALARFRFRRWRNSDAIMWFLSPRFLPPVATMIPIFLMARTSGLMDTQLGLALVNATFTMPFAVLILRDAFKDLPIELEEAALVDGASPFGVFWRIALPLCTPEITAAGIICVTFAWNEYLFGLMLTTKAAMPLTVMAGQGQTATRMLITVVPPAILCLLVQRYIVRSLTFGAVKG